MAATFGKMDEFDGNKGEWPQYVERLDFFFQVNEIIDVEKKRALFLSVLGPTTFKLLRNLLHPAKPGEQTLPALIEVLTEHYKPTPSEIVQCFRFHSRFRKPSESVATFVTELRALSEYCNFGTTLEDMLWDRLVCGINNDVIQRRLLSESKLKYAKAVELATTLETAAKDVKELTIATRQNTEESKPYDLQKIGQEGRKGDSMCYRCGNPDHLADECRFKDVTCHQCGKLGHIRSVCRNKKRDPSGKKNLSRSRPVKLVQGNDGSDCDYPLFHFNSTNHAQPIKVLITIDGQSATMEVDTGAALSLISEMTFKEWWPDRSVSATTVTLCSYSGETIPVLGSVDTEVRYKDQRACLTLLVVRGTGLSLVRRNWLECHKIH